MPVPQWVWFLTCLLPSSGLHMAFIQTHSFFTSHYHLNYAFTRHSLNHQRRFHLLQQTDTPYHHALFHLTLLRFHSKVGTSDRIQSSITSIAQIWIHYVLSSSAQLFKAPNLPNYTSFRHHPTGFILSHNTTPHHTTQPSQFEPYYIGYSHRTLIIP